MPQHQTLHRRLHVWFWNLVERPFPVWYCNHWVAWLHREFERGTGLAPVAGNEAGGPRPGDLTVDLEVLVGGRRAEVLGKSRSGCCAGLDQIAFRIPADLEGCYVPIVVRAGGVLSNHGSISVSPSRGCSDPHGFSAADLERIPPGGSFSTGAVLLSRTSIKFTVPQFVVEDLPRPGQLPPPGSTVDLRTDSGSGVFSRYDFNSLIRSRGVSGFAPLGQCSVSGFRNDPTAIDPIRATNLDAGPVLNLNGPKGAKQFTKTAGIYTARLGGGGFPGLPGGQPEYLDPGAYTLDNGSGGTDVGAFRATLNVPTLLVT